MVPFAEFSQWNDIFPYKSYLAYDAAEQEDAPPLNVPKTRPAELNIGEPDEPPSVTPVLLPLFTQVTFQWAFVAPVISLPPL